MDSVATLQRVIDESKRLVGGVTPEQLGNKTPCTEWTVRDIINHITGGATMFAVSAEQGSVPDELVGQLIGGDNLGDDYKAAFNAAADKAMSAFSDPAVLDKMVKLPFGEMPAGVALTSPSSTSPPTTATSPAARASRCRTATSSTRRWRWASR
jgi:uncharacterized protein (TIGR03086 family)